MKKLALAFSSKDRVELSRQSLVPILTSDFDRVVIHWYDGSQTEKGQAFLLEEGHPVHSLCLNVTGGPDRAIVCALTDLLQHKANYDYIGLLENDVLLDPDWLEPTLALFDNPDRLPVGAVSARSFTDRILVQRDKYAVMHNAGAGMIIFTREAAQIVLDNYRTGWWPENRAVFSQLSGLDIGKWGAFHSNEQMITADWSWDTILAAHGLATVALTPSKATMIGQEHTLEQQGLTLVESEVDDMRNNQAFETFRRNLLAVQRGELDLGKVDFHLRQQNNIMTFPHHVARHAGGYRGKWRTRWMQAFGPFCYQAVDEGEFTVPVFGPVAFHVGGGEITIHDDATGYHHSVDLSGSDQMVTIAIPRDKQYGVVTLTCRNGGCFLGMETTHLQPQRNDTTFDYNTLPEPA